jgi:hypothetical protein
MLLSKRFVLSLWAIVMASFIINPISELRADTGDSLNTTWIGAWAEGSCYTVAVQDMFAFYGNGGYMQIVDISEPNSPIEMGRVLCPAVVRSIFVEGNYAYVANWGAGLRIIDISDKLNPVVVGYIDTGDHAYDVFVSDGYAYVAADYAGLRIIDVSDPTQPVEVSYYDPDVGFANDIVVDDGIAYLVWRFRGISVLDVSDPLNPTLLSFFDDPDDDINGISVEGDWLCIAGRGLSVIDCSDPGQLDIEGYLDMSTISHVFLKDHRAYASTSGGMQIIDVSDHASPTVVGSLGDSGQIECIDVSNDICYIAYDSGLVLYNVSNPESPVQLQSFMVGSEAEAIFVEEGIAYLGCSGGLALVDVSSPGAPQLLDRIFVPLVRSVFVRGGYAYVGGLGGLYVVDVSTPIAPVIVGTYSYPAGTVDAVHVDQTRAYIITDDFFVFPKSESESFQVIDIVNPESPALIGSLETPGDPDDIFVSGDYVYLTGEDLYVVDVSTPDAPTLANTHPIGGYAQDVCVNGDTAFVISDLELSLVDVTIPESATDISTFDLSLGGESWADELFYSQGYVYVACHQSGLVVIVNVMNPSAPAQAGYYETGSYANDVFVVGDTAYVADGYIGLQIIRNDHVVSAENVQEPDVPSADPVLILDPCFPNPFNPTTTVSYEIDAFGPVQLVVYDVSGRLIKTLVDTHMSAGQKTSEWNGTNSAGRRVASGTYFLRLETDQGVRARKIMLAK